MANRNGFKFVRDKDFAYALNLVETVTWLAGKPDYLDDMRETVQTLDLFVDRWVVPALPKSLNGWRPAMSFQGISDQVAQSYMSNHGQTPLGQDCPRGQNRELLFAQKLLAFSRLPLSKIIAHLRPARFDRWLPVAWPSFPKRQSQSARVFAVSVHT